MGLAMVAAIADVNITEILTFGLYDAPSSDRGLSMMFGSHVMVALGLSERPCPASRGSICVHNFTMDHVILCHPARLGTCI